MSTGKALDLQGTLTFDHDSECPLSAVPSAEPVRPLDILNIDRPCEDIEVGPVPEENNTFTESDKHDIKVQTRRDSSTNPERPYSLDKMEPEQEVKEPQVPCADYVEQPSVPCVRGDPKDLFSRNPITGSGLNGDGVGGLKPRKLKNREGNPVTGEGYKPGATDFIQPIMQKDGQPNGAGNRIPPGGYSSGLW